MALLPLSTTTIFASFNNNSFPRSPQYPTILASQSPKTPKKPNPTPQNNHLNAKLNRRHLIGLTGLCLTTPGPALSTPMAPTFPTPLNSVVRTRVARPATRRSKAEKDKEEEVLVVDLEQIREDEYVKFDVYINDDSRFETMGEIKKTRVVPEYAGSFVRLPSPRQIRRVGGKKTALRLALTQLIEEIGADDEGFVDVVLVPTAGKDALVIHDVKIEFLA